MFRWTMVLLLLGMTVALLGYVSVTASVVRVLDILFWVFAGLFVLSFVFGRTPQNQNRS